MHLTYNIVDKKDREAAVGRKRVKNRIYAAINSRISILKLNKNNYDKTNLNAVLAVVSPPKTRFLWHPKLFGMPQFSRPASSGYPLMPQQLARFVQLSPSMHTQVFDSRKTEHMTALKIHNPFDSQSQTHAHTHTQSG